MVNNVLKSNIAQYIIKLNTIFHNMIFAKNKNIIEKIKISNLYFCDNIINNLKNNLQQVIKDKG